MPKPEIIGSARSTYTRVVCMVCEEKGIEYGLTECAARRAGAARHSSPRQDAGAAPWRGRAVRIQGHRRPISIAAFPGPQLFPSDPRPAALTEQWVSLVNTVMDRTLIRTYLYAYIAPKTADGKPDRAAIEAVMPAVRQQLEILDRAVAATGYLAGDHFTFADINLLPILDRVRLPPEGADALAGAGHLAAYYARHAERPSFVRTMPPAAPPGRAKPN